jgi:hypothetical protein
MTWRAPEFVTDSCDMLGDGHFEFVRNEWLGTVLGSFVSEVCYDKVSCYVVDIGLECRCDGKTLDASLFALSGRVPVEGYFARIYDDESSTVANEGRLGTPPANLTSTDDGGEQREF